MLSVANKPNMLSVIMLSAVMLNFVMLSVVMLSVIMLSVVKLNVVARFLRLKNCKNVVPITAFYEMAKKTIGLTDFTDFN